MHPDRAVRVSRFEVAENVRVAPDKLVDDTRDNVVDAEAFFTSRELRLEDNLKKQVVTFTKDNVDGFDF